MIIKRIGIQIELTEEEKKVLSDAVECLEDVVYAMEDEKTEETEEENLKILDSVENSACDARDTLKFFLRAMDADYE